MASSSTTKTPLPLGAIETEDGQVVIPSSRRADGSMRKPIRIRKGFRPQEEVPTYKTPAQRRREQEEQAKRDRTGHVPVVDDATRTQRPTLRTKRMMAKEDSPRPDDFVYRPTGRKNLQKQQQQQQQQQQVPPPSRETPSSRIQSSGSSSPSALDGDRRGTTSEIELVGSMQKLSVEEKKETPSTQVPRKGKSEARVTSAKPTEDIPTAAQRPSTSAVPPPAPSLAALSRKNKSKPAKNIKEEPQRRPFKSGIFPNGIPE